MNVIDLFAGCGGLSLGFIHAGYDICAAFDHWKPAIDVYRNNFSHPIIHYDVEQFNGETSMFEPYAPDIVIGGPPCQDFSSAGKRNENLGRSELTITFAKIVATLKPQWFVMENVERAIKSKAYAEAYHIFQQAGYGLTQSILDASVCGVPQLRKRLFLLGHLFGKHNALLPYLYHNVANKPMTLRDYFGNSLGIEHYYRHPRSYQRRAVFSIDEPSPTIRGVNRPIPSNYRRHPGDTAPVTNALRPLTTKERSMVQTFPQDFVFIGTKSDVEQMIGNAVPVNQAAYVARCIQSYINDTSGQAANNLGYHKALSDYCQPQGTLHSRIDHVRRDQNQGDSIIQLSLL